MLHGKKMTKELEEYTIEANQSLILKLINLQIVNGLSSSNLSIHNDLTLEISCATRLKLVENLIRNYNCTILNSNPIEKESKMNLIDENNKMVHLLIDLPARYMINDAKSTLFILMFNYLLSNLFHFYKIDDRSNNQLINDDGEMNEKKSSLNARINVLKSLLTSVNSPIDTLNFFERENERNIQSYEMKLIKQKQY